MLIQADTVDETVNYLRDYLDKLAVETAGETNGSAAEDGNSAELRAVRSLAR